MSNLISLPIPAPGSYGLNTEQDITSLQPQWASMAHNCVIDNNGRLGARKGYTFSTTALSTKTSANLVPDPTLIVATYLSFEGGFYHDPTLLYGPGRIKGNGTAGRLLATIPTLQAGESYDIWLYITAYTGGTFSVSLGGNSLGTSLGGATGYVYVSGVAGSSNNYLEISTSDWTGGFHTFWVHYALNENLVSNYSFFGNADDWTLGTGWAYGSGAALKTPGTASNLEQTLNLVAGRSYSVSFELLGSTGTVTPVLGGTVGTTRSGTGTYTEVIVAGSTNQLLSLQADNTLDSGVDAIYVIAEDTTAYFEQVFEYLDEDGDSVIVFTDSSGGIFYKNGTVNQSITPSTLPSSGNFKFQNFNSYLVGWCIDEDPIYWNGTGAVSPITFTYPSSGTSTWGNTALSAFGRLWTTDATQTVIKYSDLLVYNSFTNDAGSAGDPAGSAGIIDLKKVWPNGMDYVQAIEEFNGRIIFFGKRSILIYAYPWDPTISMQLEDTIEGIGCVARDSVQHIGEDIIFLSDSGVRSLARTIQEKSAPIGDLTKNIRKSFLTQTNGETKSKIRSVFNRETGEYILTVPTSKVDYVLNFKDRLPDGTPKITTWNLNPTGVCYTQAGILYLLVNEATRQGLATYTGYQDYDKTYSYLWHSPWISGEVFDPQLRNRDLIPKSLKTYIYGGTATSVSFQWAFDLSPTTRNANVVLDTVEVAEYGIAEYNVAEYSTGAVYSIRRPTMSGHGKLMQLRVAATINGYHFALQRLDPFIKVGSLLK